MLSIHPEAARNIEEKASKLLKKVRRGTLTQKEQDGFAADRFVSAHLTSEHIVGELVPSLSDQYGRTVAKFFKSGNQTWGLVNDDYEDLKSIVALLSKNAQVRKLLSEKFVEEEIFLWCRGRIRDGEQRTLTEYMEARARESVEQRSAWVPVALLDVEREFQVGNAVVRPVTSQMFDQMYAETVAQNRITEADARLLFDKLRKPMQGGAAVVIDVAAESRRAFELAVEAAETVIALLRAFSPAAFDPELTCACSPLGTEYQPIAKVLFIKGGEFAGYTNAPPGRSLGRWRLDNEWITEIKSNGLDDVARLVQLEKPSQFEQAVIDSHLLYSRSTMKSDLSDRLVYVLTSLESLFLKDGSEPIQQNLGERLAIGTAQSADDRLEVIRNTKAVYRLRSNYLHHGATHSDSQELKPFLLTACTGLELARKNAGRFKTVSEFCQALDRHKLGGSVSLSG